MHITFLVGNGFDLGIGLHTSYRDFYNWYCSIQDERDYIRNFKDNIKKDLKSGSIYWSNYEIGLGKYTSSFTLETCNEFIDCHEDAKIKMMEYLNSEAEKFQSYTITDEDIQKLRSGIADFYQELTPVEMAVINNEFSQDRLNNTEIRFISFNYTNALDRCVSLLAQDPPLREWETNSGKRSMKVISAVTHVHGFLDNYPLIGVNDATQIENQKLLEVPDLVDILIKPKSVEAIGELWQQHALDQINRSQIICLFGLSLGDTDAFWWKNLMLWLRGSTSRHLIVYQYSDRLQNRVELYKMVHQKREIKERLLTFSGVEEKEYVKLEGRIHVIFNTETVLRLKMGT